MVTFSHWVNYSPLIVNSTLTALIPRIKTVLWDLYTVGSHHSHRPYIFYFFLRCLKVLPANVFVVLLVFLLFNALLATLPTRFDVLGAAMINVFKV